MLTGALAREERPVAPTPSAPARRNARWRHLSIDLRRHAVPVALLLGLCLAIAAPLAGVVMQSFRIPQTLLTDTWSLANYRRLLESDILASARASLIIAFGSTIIATVVGVTLAWLVARTDVPFRRGLEALSIMPFFLSPLIGSVAWTYLGDPRMGLLNKALITIGLTQEPLINIHSYAGIIFVLGLFLVPFVVVLSTSSLRQMDSSLETAARVCGASTMRTMLRVTVPLAAPAVLSAALLAFVFAIEDLSVPLLLGYPQGIQTLSTRIYDSVQIFPPKYGVGAVVGVLLMCITALCLWLQRWTLRRRSFFTVTGRSGGEQDLVRLGRARWPVFLLVLGYVFVSAVLPLAVLALVALSARWTGDVRLDELTLANFRALFAHGSNVPSALLNSLVLATICASVGILLSVVAVYAIERTRVPGRRLFEAVLTFPVAVPGLVLAVGLLALFIHTWLFATLVIIGIGYVIRDFPLGQRNVAASFAAIHPELEEAARVGGARWLRYVRRVLLPLLRPGLIGGWLLLFLAFMREVPMSAMLSSSSTRTLAVELLNNVAFAPPGVVAAFTLMQVSILLLAACLLWLATAGGVRNRTRALEV